MRLIDADALLVKQASIAKTFARSDAQKSLMGRVMYNTEQEPTIDAIPVEWLQGIRDILHRGSSRAAGDMLNRVIEMWQKEQEGERWLT